MTCSPCVQGGTSVCIRPNSDPAFYPSEKKNESIGFILRLSHLVLLDFSSHSKNTEKVQEKIFSTNYKKIKRVVPE